MKKILFTLAALVLVAVGCNLSSSKQAAQNQPTNPNTNNASSTSEEVQNASNGRVYINREYNFQFQVPEKVAIVGNNPSSPVFDYEGDTNRTNSPGVGVQITKFSSLPKNVADACKEVGDSNPHCKGLRRVTQEEYQLFKKAINGKNPKYIQQLFTQHLSQETNFLNNGVLMVFQSMQAPGYQIEFDIFDKNNNFISIFALGNPKDSLDLAKKSPEYQALKILAESFKFFAN